LGNLPAYFRATHATHHEHHACQAIQHPLHLARSGLLGNLYGFQQPLFKALSSKVDDNALLVKLFEEEIAGRGLPKPV
jgi:hypothetical protein